MKGTLQTTVGYEIQGINQMLHFVKGTLQTTVGDELPGLHQLSAHPTAQPHEGNITNYSWRRDSGSKLGLVWPFILLQSASDRVATAAETVTA